MVKVKHFLHRVKGRVSWGEGSKVSENGVVEMGGVLYNV